MLDLSKKTAQKQITREVARVVEFWRQLQRDGYGMEESNPNVSDREEPLVAAFDDVMGILIRAYLCEKFGVGRYYKASMGVPEKEFESDDLDDEDSEDGSEAENS